MNRVWPPRVSPEGAQRYRRYYPGATWLVLGAVALQGSMAVFGAPLAVHRDFGPVVGVFALALAWLAMASSVPRSTVRLAQALPILVLLQLVFILAQSVVSVLGVLHGVNAAVIFGIALVLALDAEDAVKVKET